MKFEALNVGGSIKTRTAYNMILQAERRGEIAPGRTTIIEPTSGNQGIGLALVGAVRGYDVRIIMPDSVSVERRKICEAYGAQIELVHDDGDIGKAIATCAELAREQTAADPNAFMPDQFSNVDNVAIQRAQTAVEILDDANESGIVIDGFACGFGTGGSITGIGSALKLGQPRYHRLGGRARERGDARREQHRHAPEAWASAMASFPPSSTAASSTRPAW